MALTKNAPSAPTRLKRPRNSKAGKKAKRADEVKYRPDTEFAILPGEDPREFESLFSQLASECEVKAGAV